MVNNRSEVVKKYQQKPQFKEYKRQYYLNKKRDEIIKIAIEKKGRPNSHKFRKEIKAMDNMNDIRLHTRKFFGSNYSKYFLLK